jgi:hypothetical protein
MTTLSHRVRAASVALVPREEDIGQVVGVKPTSKTANCPEAGGKNSRNSMARGSRWRRLHLRLRLACLQPRGKTQAFDVSAHRFKTASADTIRSDVPPTIERTWRLGDVLPPIPPISAWDKEDPDALAELGQKQRNIEGIAVVDGRLYAGLRTPNVGGDILIVSAPVDQLFARGDRPRRRKSSGLARNGRSAPRQPQ